jgi:hypothetical protein
MAAILNPKWPPKYKNPPIWGKFGFHVDFALPDKIDAEEKSGIIRIIIIIRNRAKTICLTNFVWES